MYVPGELSNLCDIISVMVCYSNQLTLLRLIKLYTYYMCISKESTDHISKQNQNIYIVFRNNICVCVYIYIYIRASNDKIIINDAQVSSRSNSLLNFQRCTTHFLIYRFINKFLKRKRNVNHCNIGYMIFLVSILTSLIPIEFTTNTAVCTTHFHSL